MTDQTTKPAGETNFLSNVEALLARAETAAKEGNTVEAELSMIGDFVRTSMEEAAIEVDLSAIGDVPALEDHRDDLKATLEDLRQEITARLIEIGKSGDRNRDDAEYVALWGRFAAIWPAAKDPTSQHFVEFFDDAVAE